MTETELLDYFNEHVFYELRMLCYSMQCLEKVDPQQPDARLVWNSMFAAFNVSARNLYYFVGRRDGDNMNVADYRPYCPTFSRGEINRVEKTLTLLQAQCLHLGKKRTKEPDKKISLDRVREISAWTVSNMNNLLKSFQADFRSKLRPEWADLISQQPFVRVGPEGPSSTAVSSILATGHGPTGTGQIIYYDTTPKR
jgi:hypothetical protein